MSNRRKKRHRLCITLNDVQWAYIDQLIQLGTYGDTRAEVVRRILDCELNRLIADGILKQRKAG